MPRESVYKYIKHNGSDDKLKLIVLSMTEAGMGQLAGFSFDNNGENMKIPWTKEPRIATHYKSHIDEKNIPYEFINSLEFLANSVGNEKYFNILSH